MVCSVSPIRLITAQQWFGVEWENPLRYAGYECPSHCAQRLVLTFPIQPRRIGSMRSRNVRTEEEVSMRNHRALLRPKLVVKKAPGR
jgi:hypothetical protein